MASSADFAGDVTIGVAFSAAGDVTVGVASSADPAGVVATGVAFMEKCGEGDVLLGDYVSEYV